MTPEEQQLAMIEARQKKIEERLDQLSLNLKCIVNAMNDSTIQLKERSDGTITTKRTRPKIKFR